MATGVMYQNMWNHTEKYFVPERHKEIRSTLYNSLFYLIPYAAKLSGGAPKWKLNMVFEIKSLA